MEYLFLFFYIRALFSTVHTSHDGEYMSSANNR
jgi:hypothetical protein